jgi:hypothetical protein
MTLEALPLLVACVLLLKEVRQALEEGICKSRPRVLCTHCMCFCGGRANCLPLNLSQGLLDPFWVRLRYALLTGGVAFGLVPCAHVLIMCRSWDCVSLVCQAGTAMFLCYGIGFAFFVLHIPERWAPGWFDYVLSSHQIWHLFVWAAGAAWLEGMLAHHARAVQDGCEA